MHWVQSGTVSVLFPTGTREGHLPLTPTALWFLSMGYLQKPCKLSKPRCTYPATPRESRLATGGAPSVSSSCSNILITLHCKTQQRAVLCEDWVSWPTLPTAAPAPSKVILTSLSEVLELQHPRAFSEDSQALHFPNHIAWHHKTLLMPYTRSPLSQKEKETAPAKQHPFL